MSTFLKLYRKVLVRYPLTCQSLQTGVLMGTGDVIAQSIVEKKSFKQLNYRRTTEFFCVGTFLIGPALTNWYGFLARRFGREGDKMVALKKVAVDQICFAPLCIVLFLSTINTIQGKSLKQTKEEIETNYSDILSTNYKLWPAVQLINFYTVPLQHQVLVVQTVAIIWNAYLSWKTQKGNNKENITL